MPQHIIKIGPHEVSVTCQWRAEIYKRYLEEIYWTFHGEEIPDRLLSDPAVPIPTDPKVKDAIRDCELLGSLAKILDKYVMNGVVKDLGIWRKRDAVDPTRIGAGETQVDFLDVTKEQEKELEKIEDKTPARYENDLEKGYSDYFNWFISQEKAGVLVSLHGETMCGVEAFFRRYPLIRHAVKKCAENFRDNILIACARVFWDWDAIGEIFFWTNKPQKLTKIVSSGSDTHKGGKQVLFLTFELADHQQGKLVYKPSDVEVDYRLVGNTKDMTDHYDLGDSESLSELINDATKDSIGLPTYHILPRSPGSTLKENNGVVPIYNSYGYIEFLRHEPEHARDQPWGADIRKWDGKTSDWIATEDDVKKYYHQLGGLMAISSIFSLCDLHHENIIVHNRQPHLIDLENSFAKPIEGFDLVLGDGLKTFAVVDRDKPVNPSEGKVTLKFHDQPEYYGKKPTQNSIWLLKESGQLEQARPTEHEVDIAEGFINVVGILKKLQAENLPAEERKLQEKLQNWLTRMKECIARSIIFPTVAYYQRRDEVYSEKFVKTDPDKPNYVLSDPFADWALKARRAYRELCTGTATNVDRSYTGWPYTRDASGKYLSASPIYALQTWDHDFKDYLNCDIPSYYHRLNSTELLNARGEKVNIRADFDITALGKDPGKDSFFPQSTWEIVKSQLESLGAKRINACTNQLERWLSNSLYVVQ